MEVKWYVSPPSTTRRRPSSPSSETVTVMSSLLPEEGNVFVKWTKNGEDYATEPVITVQLDESADFVAVFEEESGR